jgi:hypothetical protein
MSNYAKEYPPGMDEILKSVDLLNRQHDWRNK